MVGTDRGIGRTLNTAPKQCVGDVIQLHTHYQTAVVDKMLRHNIVVDVLESRVATLVEGYHVIQQVGLAGILGPVVHEKDAVGSTGEGVGEDSTAGASRSLVGPIRSQYISTLGARPARNIVAVVRHPECQVAVGSCTGTCVGIAIQGYRKRKCNNRAAIIAMVADIDHPRHSRIPGGDRQGIVRRASWRWNRSRRWRWHRSKCRGWRWCRSRRSYGRGCRRRCGRWARQ